ncbi:MAG: MBL fold metallo-hydrolase, partial [Desulfovibrionaceae bacterium]
GEVRLFPLLRRSSVTCSNAFVLDAPEAVVVLDPGADPEQLDRLRDEVHGLLRTARRPVYLGLTHCHYDHSRLAGTLLKDLDRLDAPHAVLVHEAGGRAMTQGDPMLTQAALYHAEAPLLPDHLALFGERDAAPAAAPLEPLAPLRPGESALPRLRLRLGPEAALDILHTPGHSPDSLSFHLGPLLFTGDLLFAANPGVAGVAGFDQPRLLDSLAALEAWLAEDTTGSTVIPAHGPMLDTVQARGIAADMRREAGRLGDLHTLDLPRVQRLNDLCGVLLDEAGLCLAGMGGRLLRAAHYLEELGEAEAAAAVRQALDVERMEDCAAELRDARRNLERDARDLDAMWRGLVFHHRLNRLLAHDGVAELAGAGLVRRLRWLLDDYAGAVTGFRFKNLNEPRDPGELLRSALAEARRDPAATDLLASAGHEEFVRALAVRLAGPPPLRGVDVRVEAGPDLPRVAVEPVSFQDALGALLQHLAAAGARRIRLEAEAADEGGALVRVLAPDLAPEALVWRRVDYFRLLLRRQGGDAQRLDAPEAGYALRLPPPAGIEAIRG